MLPISTNHYNMITNNVAIGNYQSSYDPFDVIINLNYPKNGAQHRQIHKTHVPTGPNTSKIIIKVGIHDSPDEDMHSLLSMIIPYLTDLNRQYPNMRILFHCYAGVSRSTTLAIAYLMNTYGIPLDDAFHIAKSRRPIIQPN